MLLGRSSPCHPVAWQLSAMRVAFSIDLKITYESLVDVFLQVPTPAGVCGEPAILQKCFPIAGVQDLQEVRLRLESLHGPASEESSQVMRKDRTLTNGVHARFGRG